MIPMRKSFSLDHGGGKKIYLHGQINSLNVSSRWKAQRSETWIRQNNKINNKNINNKAMWTLVIYLNLGNLKDKIKYLFEDFS